MKDLSFYFKAIEEFEFESESIGNSIIPHTDGFFPELEKKSIAIFYCPEFRNGVEEKHGLTDTKFRYEFYKLYASVHWEKKIYDLGDVMPGERIEDTYFAVKQIVSELVKNDIIPILIGGTQDLTYPLYQGYQELEQTVNITTIDSQIDLGSTEEGVTKDGFLSQLLIHNPCFLFNYSVIGVQFPFVKSSEIDLFERLYFDSLRLGEFNGDFKKAEPLIRNSDVLCVDLQSIKSSDFRGDAYQSPNGFYAEQICQIAKYAGVSDKLSSFSILNFIPGNLSLEAHKLVAQLIWYFIDGVADRKGDFPVCSKKEYTKFIVHLDTFENDLIFYKSGKSQRWWMEVPHPSSMDSKYERHHLIPCNHEDYELAMRNELPDLWWRTFQKLK